MHLSVRHEMKYNVETNSLSTPITDGEKATSPEESATSVT